MILADKISNLRKKNGWSQEELAQKLGVTRQSVSKYEGAQSIPDLDKILKLSQIFGVTTDYLMKDELEMEESGPVLEVEDTEEKKYKVTMEMACDFLERKKASAKKNAFATLLCILSPISLILLVGASDVQSFHISENAAVGTGMSIMILLIAAAVTIFIFDGSKEKKYTFMETEAIDTEYGVTGMVSNQKEKFHDIYVRNTVIGTVFCICSIIPLFLVLTVIENDFVLICALCLTLLMVAIGVYILMLVGIPMEAMKKLLEEDDYTRTKKRNSRKASSFEGSYWLIAAAIYLAYSFITERWEISWIVWGVAGVLFPVYRMIILGIIRRKDGR